jgi:hypothetical protein
MEIQDTPRIGHRGDALDLLDLIIKKMNRNKKGPIPVSYNTGYGEFSLSTCLEALRDSIEREIV